MKYILILILLISFNHVNAQSITTGDTCPDVHSTSVINYEKQELSLSDFKTPVILIFWNTACSSYADIFPEVDSLQQAYNGKVQFIMVNKDTKDSTLRYFARKKIKTTRLICITGDKTLHTIFPKDVLPYHVWLSAGRLLRYITNSRNLTVNNLNSFLQGKELGVINYASQSSAAKISSKPFFQVGDYAYWYSSLTPCNRRVQLFKTNSPPHISATCASIVSLYRQAYDEKGKFGLTVDAKVIIEVKDKYKYVVPSDPEQRDSWEQQYCYTYDMVVPKEKKEQCYQHMQLDLKRYFGLDAHFEKRKIKAYVLIRTGTMDKLKTKGGIAVNTLYVPESLRQPGDSIRLLRNTPFKILSKKIRDLMEYLLNKPFIDKTGYTNNIDMSLKESSLERYNLDQLKKELQRYGLDLVEKYESMTVLVIKDR